MQADLTKVRQVLLNLLSNAAKFTHRGQVTLEVTRQPWVGTEGDSKAQEQILFKVTDTGIGISPEQMSHLFEPFVQGYASTTRKYGGTGLGLAIGQRFCQLMGGAIAVESQWGAGSVFTVCLPVEVASLTTKDD